MNILLTSLQVPGAASGVRVHYERLAALLRAQGHQVTVVTLNDLRPWISRVVGIVRHALTLLPGRLGERVALEVSDVVKIYFAIDRRQHYDVVNAQDVSSGWAARLALRDRVPVVVTGHHNGDPAEEIIRQQRLGGLTAIFLRRWYGLLFSRSRYFMAVSNSVLRYVAPLLPADTLRRVVYNGLDFQQFSQLQPSVGLRQRFPGRHIILNIGHLEARKNQHYLLGVAKALRCCRQDFVIGLLGKGPDEASLRAQIIADDLAEFVVLLGYHTNVAPWLQEADLYLHTALSESFGLVLIEAIAAGVPTLAFALDGTSEVLAATPDALLDQTAPPEALAYHLHTLLDDAPALQVLHTQQHDFAAAQFSASALTANSMAFFEVARQHALGREVAPVAVPRPTANQMQ
ncbi:MAG: glycosyltransferase family 4 protein [Janthinobacterium lividum]